jgi:hypothetical protein
MRRKKAKLLYDFIIVILCYYPTGDSGVGAAVGAGI